MSCFVIRPVLLLLLVRPVLLLLPLLPVRREFLSRDQ